MNSGPPSRVGLSRWWVVVMAGVIFLASLLLTQRLHLDDKITSMLPEDDPVVQQYLLVAERFHLLDAVYIDIAARSAEPSDLREAVTAADVLHDRLSRSGLFTSITYRFSDKQFLDLVHLLTSCKARLATPQDLEAMASRLEMPEIKRRLAVAKRRLIEPSGPFLKTRVSQDPLDFDDLVWKKLEALRTEGAGVQVREGRLWSRDGTHLLIVAIPRFPAVDTVNGEKLLGLLQEARASASSQGASSRIPRIAFTGSHLATLDNSTTIKGDVFKATLALSVAMLLIGFLVFRYFLFMPLIFLPAIFGLTVAAAVFGLVNPFFPAVALGLGSILVGIAVDYGIAILYPLDQSGKTSVGSMVRSLVLPLSMAAGTTIAGFVGLTLMNLPGQRQMGWFASVGILLALLFALLVLPRCIPQGRKDDGHSILPLAAFCRKILKWCELHRVLVLFLGLAILIVCAYGATRLRFEGDITRLSHLNEENQRNQEQVLNTWGTLTPTTVVVRGTTLEKALAANDRLAQVLAELQQEGLLSHHSSLAALLPAQSLQEENLKRWREFWSTSHRAALEVNLNQAAAELGFTTGIFAPFLASLEQEPPPITFEDLRETALKPLLQNKVSTQEGEHLVMSTLFLQDRDKLTEVAARLEAMVPGAVMMDKKAFMEHMAKTVEGEFHRLALISFLVITLVLYLFLIRVELVIVNLVPVLLSVLLTMGVLGLIGIPVNLISFLFVVFIFGVGVDFSIFLMSSALRRFRGEEGNESLMAGTVVLCALTSTGGFAALIFARHTALFSMGVTGVVAMLASMGIALVTVPAIMACLLPQEGRYGTPTLKTLAGAALALVYLAGATLVYTWGLRFLFGMKYRRELAARQRATRRYMHRVAVGLLKYYPYLLSRRTFLNADPERFIKPAVIVSNHQSAFDIMLILSLPVDMVMMVKRWVWQAPLLGRVVRDAGYLLVGEENGSNPLIKCQEYLRQGISIMAFPEGSRSPDGTMRRFHIGAFKLAADGGFDVIPVLISDSQSCIPYKAFWVADHHTVVRVVPRVTTTDFDYSRTPRELSRHVKHSLLEYEHHDWRLAQDTNAFWRNIRSLYNYLGAYVEMYVAWKLRLDAIYRGIDSLVPEKGRILDLGSGFGLMAAILARKSRQRQVMGLDFDARKVRISQNVARTLGNLEFHRADFITDDLPAVDAVLMIDILHYWPQEVQREIIARAAAALSTGGVLIFRDGLTVPTSGHRSVVWAEWFAMKVGHNRGAGLHFQERQFYLGSFAANGLKLTAEPPGLGRGSNTVLVFRKEV